MLIEKKLREERMQEDLERRLMIYRQSVRRSDVIGSMYDGKGAFSRCSEFQRVLRPQMYLVTGTRYFYIEPVAPEHVFKKTDFIFVDDSKIEIFVLPSCSSKKSLYGMSFCRLLAKEENKKIEVIDNEALYNEIGTEFIKGTYQYLHEIELYSIKDEDKELKVANVIKMEDLDNEEAVVISSNNCNFLWLNNDSTDFQIKMTDMAKRLFYNEKGWVVVQKGSEDLIFKSLFLDALDIQVPLIDYSICPSVLKIEEPQKPQKKLQSVSVCLVQEDKKNGVSLKEVDSNKLSIMTDHLIVKEYEDGKEGYFLYYKKPNAKKLKFLKQKEEEYKMTFVHTHVNENLKEIFGDTDFYLMFNKFNKKSGLYQIVKKGVYMLIERKKDQICNFYSYVYVDGKVTYVWRGVNSNNDDLNYAKEFASKNTSIHEYVIAEEFFSILNIKYPKKYELPTLLDNYEPKLYKLGNRSKLVTHHYYQEKTPEKEKTVEYEQNKDNEKVYFEKDKGYLINFGSFILCFRMGNVEREAVRKAAIKYAKAIDASTSAVVPDIPVFYVHKPMCGLIQSFFLDIETSFFDSIFGRSSEIVKLDKNSVV